MHEPTRTDRLRRELRTYHTRTLWRRRELLLQAINTGNKNPMLKAILAIIDQEIQRRPLIGIHKDSSILGL